MVFTEDGLNDAADHLLGTQPREREDGPRVLVLVGDLERRGTVEAKHLGGGDQEDQSAQVVVVRREVGREDVERGWIGSSSVCASMRRESGRPNIIAQTRFTVARAK